MEQAILFTFIVCSTNFPNSQWNGAIKSVIAGVCLGDVIKGIQSTINVEARWDLWRMEALRCEERRGTEEKNRLMN